MRLGIGVAAATLCGLLWATAAPAEVPTRTPDQLKQQAQNIVVGQVQAVYRTSERQANHEHTDAVAEIRITAVEKGSTFKPGDLVYARFWNRTWLGTGSPPPGSSGHHGTPKKGDSVRVYLGRGEDQGHDVLLPNGFQVVPAANGPAATSPAK